MATEAHSIEDVIKGIKESTYEVQTESRLAYSGLKKGGRARLFRGWPARRSPYYNVPVLIAGEHDFEKRNRLREATLAVGLS